MLVLPAEPPDPRLPGGLNDGDVERLPPDLPAALGGLPARHVDERLVRHRLDEAVTQEAERDPRRHNGFRQRHAFLNLRVRKLGAGADGAVVHERAAGDDHGSARNGDRGILEPSAGAVADPQLRDLAGRPRDRVLVALAAGLGVVERAEPIVHPLHLVEPRLVGLVGGVVHQAVAQVVERQGCFGQARRRRDNSQ